MGRGIGRVSGCDGASAIRMLSYGHAAAVGIILLVKKRAVVVFGTAAGISLIDIIGRRDIGAIGVGEAHRLGVGLRQCNAIAALQGEIQSRTRRGVIGARLGCLLIRPTTQGVGGFVAGNNARRLCYIDGVLSVFIYPHTDRDNRPPFAQSARCRYRDLG